MRCHTQPTVQPAFRTFCRLSTGFQYNSVYLWFKHLSAALPCSILQDFRTRPHHRANSDHRNSIFCLSIPRIPYTLLLAPMISVFVVFVFRIPSQAAWDSLRFPETFARFGSHHKAHLFREVSSIADSPCIAPKTEIYH